MKSTFYSLVGKAATIAAAGILSFGVLAQDSDKALDLDALLKQLEEGKFAQTQQNKQREADFVSQRAEQERILREQFF